MQNKDFFAALDSLEHEKQIPKQVFIDALTTALNNAYKKQYGNAKQIEVVLVPEKSLIKIVASLTVVEEVENKDTEISLEDAKLIDKKYKVGDKILEDVRSKEFDRVVIQNARQLISQKLREEENRIVYEQISEKEGELVTSVIKRIEGKNVYVGIMNMDALLAPQDQLRGDKYRVGDKIKVYVKKTVQGKRGPQISVSRANAEFVRRLFEMEVPEIKAGQVEIKNIVREPGYRTKMSVYSADSRFDPIGACVGNRGTRVNNIVAELGGEKIEIILWDEDILEYIARSMSPAKVKAVVANDAEKSATVYVAQDMLSLAIGREGQNARLAARLTNWKIDVKPYSEEAVEAESAQEDEVFESMEDSTAETAELPDDIDVLEEDVNIDDISMDDISLDDFDTPDDKKE